MPQKLDLTKAGKLWAKCEHEQTTTFRLVLPDARYTKDKLAGNPAVDPRDELMSPWVVSYAQANGQAVCDLATTGRAGEIMTRLNERYERGEKKVEQVRALMIASAREGNRIPNKFVAETIDFDLVTIPSITLKGTGAANPWRTYVTVQNFKAGVKEFKLELSTTGMNEVEITTAPGAHPIRVEGGPSGNGKLVAPVVEGKKYTIVIPVPLKMRQEQRVVTRRRPYIHYVPGGWRSVGNRDMVQATDTREVWDGAFVTVRVAGTGDRKGIVKSITCNAEAWASAWLWKNPPPPFYHNVS